MEGDENGRFIRNYTICNIGMLLSKTPVRIAFGGGGTDVEPYCSDYGGYVVNATINYYFRSILNTRQDGTIKIFSNDKFAPYRFEKLKELTLSNIDSDLIKAIIFKMQPEVGMDIYLHGEPPKRAGLGASASLATCLIAGISDLQDNSMGRSEIAETAFKVEDEVLKNIGGRQDQYAAVYGGFNGIEFLGDDNVRVSKIHVSDSFMRELEKRILLYYTGEPHTSGNIVREQVNSYLKDKEKSKSSLDTLKNIVYRMKDAIKSEDFEQMGALLTKDLKEKTKFNPLLTTDHMEKLHDKIMENGGLGGRVCGAGGGGCMFWMVPPNKREHVIEKLKTVPGKDLPFKFVKKGLRLSNI